ncbi:MAG: glycosyl hydrolase family 16 [Flavobacteriaceae bacterium]|nr:glycosyl hydrolase family 16 [Flavobacteriaceae bacterium]
MKSLEKIKNQTILTLLLALVFLGCERDISDDAVLASFASTAEIFTDSPVGMGSDFYFPYRGSKATAWSVDDSEGYESSSSMRFDVPNATDPEGTYAGAIFRVEGAGRDLTNYDALTFWIKASQGVVIGELGFGEDFINNEYITTLSNVSVGTNWQKVIIPIPDASKLIQERGLFRYSAGTQATNGLGYTFWIDELKFEKLGTIAQPRPSILNGNDVSVNTFIGVNIDITDLNQTFNLGNGRDVTIAAAPKYFTFSSSNPSVASVNDLGVVEILSAGTAVVSATLGGEDVKGSLNINSIGSFSLPPTPTRNASDVISIFSDYYTNTTVDFYNGYWQPYQTTESADFSVNGDNFLNYTNFNFVGIQFSNPTIDITSLPNLHFNMYIPNGVPSNFDFLVTVVDFGPDGVNGGTDDTRHQLFVRKTPSIVADSWMTIEFSLNGLTNKSNVGILIFENINFSSLTNFYLDNIYFYK